MPGLRRGKQELAAGTLTPSIARLAVFPAAWRAAMAVVFANKSNG